MSGVFERSHFGGGVIVTDYRPLPLPAVHRKSGTALSRMRQPAIQGWAARFNKPHTFKGGVDVFAIGAFDASLASGKPIRMQIAHDDGQVVGSTLDRLELRTDAKGLAFRFILSDADESLAELVESRQCDAVSVGYKLEPDGWEMKNLDGVDYRQITSVDLDEVSVVRRGAVTQAFATVVDLAEREPLAIEMKSAAFESESAYRKLMRTLVDRR